ncbi:Exocyst complex component EXO84A [Linum perenne]
MLVEDASEEPQMNPKFLMAMQASITEQRMRFAEQLSETISQPSTRRLELRSAVQALKQQLGDGPRAHTLLLQYHLKKLQASMRSIRSSNNSLGGGGGSYATVISQFVFSTIARAMSDSMLVFGEESSYTSELKSWAVKQTESFALLLKRHVLASSAATDGLRVSADSFHANLKKIDHSTAALAVTDDWVLSFSPSGGKAMSSPAPLSVGSQPKLSSSANKLNSMVQEFLEDIVPLECLHLDGPALEGVQRAFNSLQALELTFTDDGETNLNAHTYTSMDDHTEEPEWFPSPIFQLLFTKITNLASTATDVFVGRERFATVLLMRLMETIILWLSDDQAFWEEIEQGAKPLGPFGLQQLYLDMEFVLIFASQGRYLFLTKKKGRYLSRSLHKVIKDIIARAIDAASATGVDPYSVLPEED